MQTCPKCGNPNVTQSTWGNEAPICTLCDLIWTELQQSEITALKEDLASAREQIAQLNRDRYLSVSDYCAKYGVQNCSSCERIECCDNTSPAKVKIRSLTELACKYQYQEMNDGQIGEYKPAYMCVGCFAHKGRPCKENCEFNILKGEQNAKTDSI